MWSTGLMLAAGCGDETAPPIAKPTPPAATPVASQAADGRPALIENNVELTDETSKSAPPPVIVSDPAVVPAAPAEPQPEEMPSPERIAILTPGGPLLVDVRLTIDGEPHSKAFDALVKRLLDAGDSDHDGQSTWKELAADRAYLEKEMPNAPAPDSRQMKSLIERYDENRDGNIQSSEAAAWLGRNAGTSAKPLAVRSKRSYRPVPRATSQVWRLVDGDDDGRLTSKEIAGASNRLLALDADDDRILAPAEMASLREQLEAAGQQRTYASRAASHYAAMHLDADFDMQRLHYLLSNLYAPRQDLGPSSFSQLSDPFKKLDGNGNGWFDGEEMASMRSAEPQMQMTVAFNQPANDKGGSATIDVKTLIPEVTIVAQPSADRAVIVLGNTRLILSAHNLAAKPEAEQNEGQATARNQIRLMVHDESDALFEELDANADGRLGEREIAYSSQRLAQRDRNGDGELSGDEFPYSMIVAFLLSEQASEKSFYNPPTAARSAPTSDKPLPGWFKHADLNGDGDVSRREFLGSAEHFGTLDADKDGYIGAGEL